MIRVEMIQAEQGDCIWIEYGKSTATLQRILIDGGVDATFKHLKKRLLRLPRKKRHFELLVITHIDADHIAGILKLFEATSLGVTFGDIWFNGYRHLHTRARLPKGVKQAERVTRYLEQEHISWNRAFQGHGVCVNKAEPFTPIELSGGMTLTLLSPTSKELSKLAPHWLQEAEKAGLFKEKSPYPTEITRSNSETQPLTITQLAAAPFKPDNSLTNSSSIAFIAEYENRKMLFSGDASAVVLLHSLQAYLSQCQPLYLDLFKLPHHGSEGNISKELLERLRCSRYLISSNGAYHHHPDRVAIARVLQYGGNRPDLYFNYRSLYNEIWHDASLQKQCRFSLHYPRKNRTGIRITL